MMPLGDKQEDIMSPQPKKKKLPKLSILSLAVIASLVMSVATMAMVYSATTQTFTVGKNLVSISASYGFSSNNNTIVG